jgi:hypothetical protein
MPRGLLANILNVPPLIFRFQLNPDILQEKKQFKYEQTSSFGKWRFDNYEAGSGLDAAIGLWEDVKEIGSLLTATKPMEAVEGAPRRFSLEFRLDASNPGPEETDHFGGSIEPDLAVLRSFMYPAYDDIDIIALAYNSISAGSWTPPCWKRPPLCTLVMGPLVFDTVMESLDIKVTAFFPDLAPEKADVSVTLAEQTNSPTPFTDTITRYINAGRALNREGIWEDIGRASPVGGAVYGAVTELFL